MLVCVLLLAIWGQSSHNRIALFNECSQCLSSLLFLLLCLSLLFLLLLYCICPITGPREDATHCGGCLSWQSWRCWRSCNRCAQKSHLKWVLNGFSPKQHCECTLSTQWVHGECMGSAWWVRHQYSPTIWAAIRIKSIYSSQKSWYLLRSALFHSHLSVVLSSLSLSLSPLVCFYLCLVIPTMQNVQSVVGVHYIIFNYQRVIYRGNDCLFSFRFSSIDQCDDTCLIL